MNIFNVKIDDIFVYSVLNRRNNDYIIKRLESKKDEIGKYFDNMSISSFSVDNMLDYSFCKYILEIDSTSNKFTELKDKIISVINLFERKKINQFIINNYLNMFNFKISDSQKNILIYRVITEIITQKILIDENKLVKMYSINIFDNKVFFSKYKTICWSKLSQKKFICNLLEYRYIQLIKFLKDSNTYFKNQKNYNKIIEHIIEYTMGDKNIIKKENNCEQLIYFLEYIKDYRVNDLKLKYEDIKKQKAEYIKNNGIKISKEIDVSEIYQKFESIFKDTKLNALKKVCTILTVLKGNKVQIAVENIAKIQPPITDILIGNSAHPYYRPYLKTYFEQVYIKHEMNLLLNYYLKYIKYDEFEKILTNIISDIYEYVLLEYYDIEYYKQTAKNILTTIDRYKNGDKDSKKFDTYTSAVYLTTFLEKLLRTIFIKACLNKKEYIDTYTLKDFFEDERIAPMRTIIGNTLFLWLKYYLYYDTEIVNGIVIKEGLDIRNNIAHGMYDFSQDFSEIYIILLFLTINILFAIEINMIEYPSYKTEQIMKRIINKSNVKKLDF